MKFHTLPLLAMLAVPAAAQERWQVGLGANFKDSTSFTATSTDEATSFKRRATFAPALQVGYRTLDFGAWDLTVTGEYQFPTRYRATNSDPDLEGNNYRMSFFAPGLQLNHHLHKNFDWGLGVQMRFTDYKDSATGTRANFDRPWAEVHARYTFQNLGEVRPYAGLRLARALVRTADQPSYASLTANPGVAARNTMRRLDGLWELSLQTGVRF